MIEKHFNIPFVADLALREKQIQQNYRPIIAVHKWFARRPGTLFRALLLAEFSPVPLKEAFFRANDFKGLAIADPFMGGGTPLIEANRVGCDVVGYDINPMAYWIVKQELEYLDLQAYQEAVWNLRDVLEKQIGRLYRTQCLVCGDERAHVKYFLWIKVQGCSSCGKDFDLFPGYLIAENKRHPKNVLLCAACGALSETDDRKNPGSCRSCGAALRLQGPAGKSRCPCPHCGAANRFPRPELGPPRHRLIAIEYHCPACRPTHAGRFFKKPDENDLTNYNTAATRLRKVRPEHVPDDSIPSGDETDRLHRWGYSHYREMFNARQLLGLELSARFILAQTNERVRNALATNLSDLLRYQNMLCRYDTMALKSLDIFSVHGFPVGLLQCESNFLGILGGKNGILTGSGGWANITEKFNKAKSYAEQPFEIRHVGGRKTQVPIPGEWIGDRKNTGSGTQERTMDIRCGNPGVDALPSKMYDAVLTDPPYFGNVQYAELMDFCYVWLRKLIGKQDPAFTKTTTRNSGELTGNVNMGRGVEHFTEGLSAIYRCMAAHLKTGSPFAFTYHHNKLEAYFPIAVALLDAKLTCSAALPCPAEMGASIHINGTGSSIIDTVFICRSTGKTAQRLITGSAETLATVVKEDLENLRQGNVPLSQGDLRCIIYGHLIRLAIWFLREHWDVRTPTPDKLRNIAAWIDGFGGLSAVKQHIADDWFKAPSAQQWFSMERGEPYGENDEISF